MPPGGNHTQCPSRPVGGDGGQTTNLLSTDQYKEIILVEDEELVASGSQMGTSRGSKSIYSSTKMTVWTEAPYR